MVDTLGFNGYAELDARGQPTSPAFAYRRAIDAISRRQQHRHRGDDQRSRVLRPPFTIKRSWNESSARHPFEYDCMENPRQEDFENAYYVRDRYRPTCMRVEGEGLALSKMVCRR